jgi:hypothetical protein
MITVVLLAILVATVVASGATLAPGTIVRTWIRRVFLAVINLSPWITGTWRSEFSTRETFMAAWFLSFVVALIGLSLTSRNWLG